MKSPPIITAIAAVVLCPILARAAIVAGWNINGLDVNDGLHEPAYTNVAGTTAVHVTSAYLALSGNVNPSTTANQYGFKISASDAQATLAGAIAEGHYMEIRLIATEPYGINLTTLDIKGQTTTTGCDGIAVLSSVDGFSVGKVLDFVMDIQNVTGGFDTDNSGLGAPIDLSDPKFSELQDVTFRIYGWDSSNTSGAGVSYIRDLTFDDGLDLFFTGTVAAIPRRGTMVEVE